jgi:antitoxin CptB
MSDLSRLRWLCRRGMKELDVVLETYLEHRYPSAVDDEQKAFRELLELTDPQLFGLLLGREEADDEPTRKLVKNLRTITTRS